MKVGGINTTERCNLHCAMCHFHGPRALGSHPPRTLKPELVMKYITEVSSGQELWFSSMGEFFMDPNALTYLHNATNMGFYPCVLTNGQLLTPSLVDKVLDAGVRHISISVDAIDPERYRLIRSGGDFNKILSLCSYLKEKKQAFPTLRFEFKTPYLKDLHLSKSIYGFGRVRWTQSV